MAETISFSLKTTPRFANAIRRYAIDRIKVLAIDKVIIYENRSAYFDEYIAHRIGQIPLVSTAGKYKVEDVGFYLDVMGPGVVYSEDLKSNNDHVKVAIERIPIVTLAEGQSLRLEAYIKEGIGRDHAKFQASVSSYDEKDGEYTFFIESLGQLPAEEIGKQLISNLTEDLKSLKESLHNM